MAAISLQAAQNDIIRQVLNTQDMHLLDKIKSLFVKTVSPEENVNVVRTAKGTLKFPKIPKDFKAPQDVLDMAIGKLPDDFDYDKEVEAMYMERAR